MLRQNRSCINWQFLLLGLFVAIIQCDARAVNVSNTWTMPQEGLNVFYRFFRDRISWFEADAVCQFHHANLVTVDNSFQFDATRDLLRELDVNDIVWIGLMRPQSSDRFMWSNSRALVADTGYWAESLPLMDAPLCAVIDPIRDYRWHALRCGGPETASFLCEMPVPGWADACNLKDMPNLTLQYMADTASIELIRNCQEEGLLRTMCRGKQDRESALQNLICPRERLEAQRINDITNSHFKSLQIINSIPSDNNENNDIELLPLEINYGPHYPEELQTEKNTVQRLIEQFNVDELMQADEPSNIETVSSFYKIPGLIPKPVKKSAKKAFDATIKKDTGKPKIVEQTQKEAKRLPVEMDEMMMGDQPLQGEPEMPEQFLNEEVSNEILEHLPHIKKTNLHKEDGLEIMEKEATAMKKDMQKTKEMENKKLLITTATTTTAAAAISSTTTTTAIPLTAVRTLSTAKADDFPRHYEDRIHKTHLELDSTEGHLTTTTAAATISHPMHPQKPHNGEEIQHSHTKESTDNSHFIPPLLMVKSHYVPPATSKHAHNDLDHHQHYQQHLKHEGHAAHLETTTKEQTETTQNRQHTQTQDSDRIMVTTEKMLDSQPTTLKILDSSLSSEVATATEKDGSSRMKQTAKEMEQTKNAENLNLRETATTSTVKTLQSEVFATAKTVENIEITSVFAGKSQEINKSKNIPAKYNYQSQDIQPPQTLHTKTNADTTPATIPLATTEQSLKSTQKFYDLETATDTTTEKLKDMPEITTLQTITPTAQQQELQATFEKKLTVIKQQENKEHLQITTATTEKLTAPQTKQAAAAAATTVTITTINLQPVTQQTPISTDTAIQSLKKVKKDQANKAKPKEDKENEQNKEDTIVKTTETLQTSTTVPNDQNEDPVRPTTAALTTTADTSVSTITTVKAITTTLPQNVEKSTQTSFSSTRINNISSATKNAPIVTLKEKNTSIRAEIATSSTTPPTTTTFATMPDFTSTTPATTELEITTGRVETSTQTSSTAPETTRNFLKVTTETPFKPNRRRSLTKPETVSYMKKILG